MKWAAESIHAVVFRAPTGETPDALQPWLKVFGDSPGSFQRNAADQSPGSVASATVGEFQATISAQTGRQELILAPAPSGDQPPAPIENVEAALSVLGGYTKKMLGVEPVVRVALVLNLSKRHPDLYQAVEGFKVDSRLSDLPGDAMDLQFAINVRKPFVSHVAQMNRLCRWGTATQQFITMQLAPGGLGPSMFVREFPAETLQIDVNSHPQERHLAPDRAVTMFDELVAEALLIMAQGYDRLIDLRN